MINKNLFTSNSQHWCTPSELYKSIILSGYYDPCTLFDNSTNLLGTICNNKIYVNPPFNNLSLWVDWILRCIDQSIKDKRHQSFILCMPTRTDTIYFDKLLSSKHVSFIYFIRGRLHFNDSKKVAPFPTMFIFIDTFCYNHTWCETISYDFFLHNMRIGMY